MRSIGYYALVLAALMIIIAPSTAAPKGLKTSNVKPNNGGTDVIHLTPKGGSTAPISVPIPGGTNARNKAKKIAKAINDYRKAGQPTTPVFKATVGVGAKNNEVTVTDAAGNPLSGFTWSCKTKERKDYLLCASEEPEDTTDYVSIYLTGDSPSGQDSDGTASQLEVGPIGNTVILGPGDYADLDSLRLAIVTELAMVGVMAMLGPDEAITFEINSGNGVIMGSNDLAFDHKFGVVD